MNYKRFFNFRKTLYLNLEKSQYHYPKPLKHSKNTHLWVFFLSDFAFNFELVLSL
jgi:hypothetical protein